jgi:NIPSNAP
MSFISAQHEKAHDALRPFLRSRATQLAQEFAFLPTSPPRNAGGIFELRAYQLNPGTLLEWEATWCVLINAAFGRSAIDCITLHRRKGIEARSKFVRPVGAWYAQLGRLHQVYHLWQYPCVTLRCSHAGRRFTSSRTRRSLETRKEMRENAWQVDGWADTVHKARHGHPRPIILLIQLTDRTTGEDDGLAHPDAVIIQSA